MPQILSSPLFTVTLPRIENLDFPPGSTYVVGDGLEEEDRTQEWKRLNATGLGFVRVVSVAPTSATVAFNGACSDLPLRSQSALTEFLLGLQTSRLHIDITGLPLHVWAPLVRAALNVSIRTRAVYFEPGDYRYSTNPIEGEIFDLSDRIDGIAPIPGFACLSRFDLERALFVPILGFEGTRLAHILEAVQPARENIWPIIGVPGTRIQYPFFAYLGNKGQLLETHSWKNALYARANCPFSLYYVLRDRLQTWHERLVILAPLGPKPHALGAILYYLANPRRTELVYDHPITRAQRTVGTPRVCIYDLSAWANLVGFTPSQV